jgi:plastocyanin
MRWAAMALAAMALAAACGGGTTSETRATPTAGGGAAPTGAIVIVATDNQFDKTELTVRANQPVTLTLENRGQAIHNWHVLNVKDKDGKEITTNLLTGGQSQTITFVITQTGTFDYQCDVHPTEMRGKLTVQ